VSLCCRLVKECTSSESLLPINPFTAEQMASIKNLKNPAIQIIRQKQFKETQKENKIVKTNKRKSKLKPIGLTVRIGGDGESRGEASGIQLERGISASVCW
jgi:hypothetical protein